VFLPLNSQAKHDVKLDQWRGHKLSKEAVHLLERLTGQDAVGINSDWLKLQPWLSDNLAHDWEDESRCWADEASVRLDALLEGCLSGILSRITESPVHADFTFVQLADEKLVSDPPSLDYHFPADKGVILDCYPRSRTLFFRAGARLVVALRAVRRGRHGLRRARLREAECGRNAHG